MTTKSSEQLHLEQQVLAYEGRIKRATELKHHGWEEYVAEQQMKLDAARTALAELPEPQTLVTTRVRTPASFQFHQLSQQQHTGVLLPKTDKE